MSIKETKRKGFNFFRSYFDVYNELETDKDKVAFIDALLNRQFLGIKPTDLKGLAKFAYISQTNSIDSQVKGYEDKTKVKLTPTEPPTVGVKSPPTEQVEEKEKVQDVINFNKLVLYINKKTGRNFKVINNTLKSKYKARLKDGYNSQDIFDAINNSTTNDYHKETNFKYLTPEFFSRSTTLDKYSNINSVKKEELTDEKRAELRIEEIKKFQ